MNTPRGKRVAFIIGCFAMLVVAAIVLTRWERVAVGYYLLKLHEPGTFEETIQGAERNSLRWKAVREYVRTEKGARELISRIIDPIEKKKLGKGFFVRVTQAGPAILLIQNGRPHNPNEVEVVYNGPALPDLFLGVDTMPALMELFPDAARREVVLPDYPSVRFAVLPVSRLREFYTDKVELLGRRKFHDHGILVTRIP